MPALGLKMRIDRLTSLIASVYQTGLQMWHKFTATTWDGSTDRLPDSSPVGTNTAALYTGRGLSFDGVNDVVTVGATGVTVKTVVFYAYPDSDTTAFMQLQSTGAVRIEIATGTLSATGFTSPTLYVNGAASSTVAATTWQQIAVTSATGVSASNVLLGQSNTTYYGGDLSNVKFFSVELTAGQIAELYANPEQALPTGVSAGDLVGWWNLGNSANHAFDGSSYNNLGLISGATIISAINSPVKQDSLNGQNHILNFDGVNDYISGINTVSGLSAFSVVVSFTIYDTTPVYRVVSLIHTGSDQIYIMIPVGASEIRAAVRSSGSFVAASRKSGPIGPYKIYHVVYTYDGVSTYNLYINNTLATGSNQPGGTLGSVTQISGRDGAFELFKGIILQCAIYNSALSASEVSDITSQGVALDLAQNSGNYASANSLQGYWKNLGTANSDWIDRSGRGSDGVVNGSPSGITIGAGLNGRDVFGNSFKFPNNGEMILRGAGYATATDAATLDITTDITLEAWVKPFTVASLQTAIGKNSAYALNVTSAAKLQFQRWSSTTSATVSSSASLTSDTWYHIAATYDGTTTKLYINGTEDTSSGAVTGAIDSTATDVLLGALTTSTNLFSGYLDSVKVYDEILTAAQIKQNYNAEKGSHSNS